MARPIKPGTSDTRTSDERARDNAAAQAAYEALPMVQRALAHAR